MMSNTFNNSGSCEPLPEDVSSLQSLVRQLKTELTIEKLGRQKAEAKVKDLLRRMFGPRSEKLNALQGLLFAAATAGEHAAAAAREAIKRGRAATKRLPSLREKRRVPTNLPVLDTISVDMPEAERVGLEWMRAEVSYEQDYRASQFFLRAIVRPVYGHPQKLQAPRIAPMPVRVIPRSMVGPGFLAYIEVAAVFRTGV